MLAAAPTSGAPAPTVLDAQGGPLPEGAIARLGTVRLRAWCDSLHFSADGTTLVGIDRGRLVRIWDAADGKLLRSLPLPGRPERDRWATRTARSTDGNTLVLCDDSTLEMWDVGLRKRLDVRLPRGLVKLERFAVSDDRQHLALVRTVAEKLVPEGGGFGFEQTQHLLLWDTTTGKQRVLADDEKQAVALALAPDGKRLASSSYGKGTCVWDVATGALLWRQPKYNAEAMAFTPDGRRLIASPGGGQLAWHTWDAATGRSAEEELRPPTVGYVWSFAVSPDGNNLLAPTATDYVLWGLKEGKVLQRWPGANQAGRGVFAPDGRSVVTHDTLLRRWDVASGKALYPDVTPQGHTRSVLRLLFTPDGKYLASIGADDVLRVWELSSSKPLHTIALGAPRPSAWAMTPDGATVVGVDEALTVRQWSLADGRLRQQGVLREASDLNIGLWPVDVRVTPDGQTLVLAAWPKNEEYRYRKYSFSLWGLRTGALRRWGHDPGREYRGANVTLSPDGRALVKRQNGEGLEVVEKARQFAVAEDLTAGVPLLGNRGQTASHLLLDRNDRDRHDLLLG